MLLYHLWINEWKRLWKSPALLLVTLLLPVALLIVVGFVVYSSVQEDLEEVEMVIIDEDETFETKALINQLAGDQTLAEQIHFIDGGRIFKNTSKIQKRQLQLSRFQKVLRNSSAPVKMKI